MNTSKKIAVQLATTSVLALIFLSCASTPAEFLARQKIPIEIQSGKPVTIKIRSLSGDGLNDVGIQCSPEVWNALTNGTRSIEVKLVSSNNEGTQISGISPGSRGTWRIESFHHLFWISGVHHAKASVEIVFPMAPPGVTRAEIIVHKTPPAKF